MVRYCFPASNCSKRKSKIPLTGAEMGWRFRSAHQLIHCLQAEAYADFVELLQDLLSILITPSESPLLRYDSLIWARRLGGDGLPWPLDGALLLDWSVCPESLAEELESSLASGVELDTMPGSARQGLSSVHLLSPPWPCQGIDLSMQMEGTCRAGATTMGWTEHPQPLHVDWVSNCSMLEVVHSFEM